MKIRVYWAYPDLFEIRHTYQDIPLPSNYVLTEENIKQAKQKAAKILFGLFWVDVQEEYYEIIKD